MVYKVVHIITMCNIRVTSSEKVDKGHRYHNDFNLVSMSYPGLHLMYSKHHYFMTTVIGCEFFKEYRENEHLAQGLRYNWAQVLQCFLFLGNVFKFLFH